MKALLLSLILAVSLAGCSRIHPDATWTDESIVQNMSDHDNFELGRSLMLHRYLDGNHLVRKLIPQTKTETTTESSGSFFLIAGEYSSETKTSTKSTMTFAWLMADGAYAITTVNLSIVRIQLIDNTQPHVYFKWHTPNTEYSDNGSDYYEPFNNTAEYYSRGIREVTVVCRPEDWPISIMLPLNK